MFYQSLSADEAQIRNYSRKLTSALSLVFQKHISGIKKWDSISERQEICLYCDISDVFYDSGDYLLVGAVFPYFRKKIAAVLLRRYY